MGWIDELKNTVKISDVVSRYFILPTRFGTKHIMKCPFHKEKTASFSVDNVKNMFYCFGCRAGGDSIKFVQMIDSLSFIDACKKIAEWYHILIETSAVDNEAQILDKLSNWFQSEINHNEKALEYLQNRGLSVETIQKFEIGWLGSRHAFLNFCNANHINQQSLDLLGIKNNMLFLLENRIIFPIHNKGKIVAFGGRTIDPKDERAKYINTSESRYFQKKEILYGLNKVKHPLKYLILVEGYLDTCIANQCNFPAVSSLGTAVCTGHIQNMWQVVDDAIICFDGDSAGQKAMSKLAQESLNCIIPGKTLSFIKMPQDEDPASFLQNNDNFRNDNFHNDNFLYLIENRQYLVDELWSISNPKAKKVLEQKVAAYQELLSQAAHIQDKDLRRIYINEWKSKWFSKKEDKSDLIVPIIDIKYTYELILFGTILYYRNILHYVCDYLLTIDLSDQFHLLREILLQSVTWSDVDFIENRMIKYWMALCPLIKLNKIAPFTRNPVGEDHVISGWMEIFSFYIEFLNR